MRQMQFNLDLNDDTLFGPACAELAEALVAVNMLELRSTPDLPCCLGCGEVRYTLPVVCDNGPRTAATTPRPRRTAPVGFSTARRKRPAAVAAPPLPDAVDSCQALLDVRGIYKHKRGTCCQRWYECVRPELQPWTANSGWGVS